jgi:hypothetical protein
MKLDIQDLRSASIMRFDPDTATAYETWIKSFLTDLEARYKGHGVHAEVELKITLSDR